MSIADNTPEQGNGNPAAGGQELSIPKHRFDEVSARLRQREEELALKDRIYMEHMQAQRQPQAPEDVDITPEETGLDPQTHQAVLKAAKVISSKQIEKAGQQFRQLVGHLGNRVEIAEFISEYGKDKSSYLPLIQEEQRRHLQNTGAYMDMKTAYKLVRFEESERRSAGRDSGSPAPSAQTPAPAEPSHLPNPANTRVGQGSGAAPGAKSFAELSAEEMEARLEESFRSGNLA